MANRGTFRKGQSGNPKGRPSGTRALAAVLRAEAERDSYAEISSQELLARALWEGLSMGSIGLISGKRYDLNFGEWMALVKWMHLHVDGNYHSGTNEAAVTIDDNGDEVHKSRRPVTIQYGDYPSGVKPWLFSEEERKAMLGEVEAEIRRLTDGERDSDY